MIYLGADHGGFELKEKLQQWLVEWGYAFEDLGAHEIDPTDDYPQFAFAVAEAVSQNPEEHKGILACRSGAGVVIAANKVKHVRAVSPTTAEAAEHSRQHNNANIMALSGDWMTEEEAKAIAKKWLESEFSGEERHSRRNQQIEQYEQEH